jgi:hypothetical protein
MEDEMINDKNEFLKKAEESVSRNDIKAAKIWLKQALKADINDDRTWKLLYKIENPRKSFNEFKTIYAHKYFPSQVDYRIVEEHEHVKNSKRIEKYNIQSQKDEKIPNVWEWGWKHIPSWLRPIILVLVLLLLGFSFLLGIIKNAVDIQKQVEVTPMLATNISLLRSKSMAINTVLSYAQCPDTIWVIQEEYFNKIPNEYDKAYQYLDEFAYTLVPAEVFLNVIQEKRSDYDDIVITAVTLQVDEYESFTIPGIIIIGTMPCASPYYGDFKDLGLLQINSSQTMYDVLRPRATSPQETLISLSNSVEGLTIGVGSIQPGYYKLSIVIDYVRNGQKFKTAPMKFNMAVPERAKTIMVYKKDIMDDAQPWSGPFEPQTFLYAYENQQNIITIRYVYDGTRDQRCLSIVNMGKDLDMTDWTVVREDGLLSFQFPPFILRGGSGVNIWEQEGNNTYSDLYGGLNFPSEVNFDKFFQLYDANKKYIARTYPP